jgi:hypothetical protein
MFGEQNPGTTITACPSPLAASSGKGDGEIVTAIKAATSRNQLPKETVEPR